jgi:hypothetical protein
MVDQVLKEIQDHLITHQVPDIVIGYSASFSFDEAYKDAISNIKPHPFSDYIKYIVSEIGYERGGITQVDQMFVKLKRVVG